MVKDAGVSTSEAPSPKMALKLKNTYIDSTSFSFADEFNDLTFDGPRTVKTIKRQISPYSAFSEHEEPDLEKEPQMQEHKEPGECWETWRLADSIPNDDLDTEGLLAHPGMAPLFPFGHMPNMPMVSPGWMPMLMPMLPPMAGGSHMGMPGFPNLAAPIPSVGFEDSAIVHTVMMRNLPNKYTQQMLLEEINLAGFAGTFDFFYLPIDPETHANRGYAFVNFDNPRNAHKFMAAFEGRQMHHFNSKKVVSCMAATLQGFEANYSHYATARVSRGEPHARPLFLREPRPSATMQNSMIKNSMRRPRQNGMSEGNRRVEGPGTYNPTSAAQLPPPFNTSTTMPLPAANITMSEQTHAEQNKYGAKRFCAACGGKRKPEYKFCQFCGASLP
eukprot:gnl/TRDRNA2_/TRDRNA2_142384_c1_seq1.p1 gnl/TRDRNA2_/TRDRNA2_142384_c1~~gnl/TRDRNA2_/TRDRNA2_142384_c1_seq1.p1  ORF type:complete len:409 (+),score=83.17 gnl/TRDRNA2_/TRDRNA2_142384_c1_seq1:66-1229(+)